VTPEALARFYRGYIDCLNRQDWDVLGTFVHEDVSRNGQPLGVDGYRDMLIADFDAIPDLRFSIDLLVCEPPTIASRLYFDCRPRGTLFGLAIDGQKVQFHENVFYRFQDDRIHQVWSIIDTAAIAAQLKTKTPGYEPGV
jgi:predicted ester cyclase